MTCTRPFKKIIKGIQRTLPCGKCVNCKKGKAYDWSLRIKNHMTYNNLCSFVTLTYETPVYNELTPIYSLSKRDLQLFFKRLRKYYQYADKKISYFACGEYGEKTGRPHYHILLFGLSLMELDLKKTMNHLHSRIIEEIWGLGYNEVGQVETDSIYYVTGYILKNKFNHREMDNREPEFNLMSKNLGLEMLNENWDEYVERYLKHESIPSYYWRLINEEYKIDNSTGLSANVFGGYKKQAFEHMKKYGSIDIETYRKALREIIEGNLQDETDTNTLRRLNNKDKL